MYSYCLDTPCNPTWMASTQGIKINNFVHHLQWQQVAASTEQLASVSAMLLAVHTGTIATPTNDSIARAGCAEQGATIVVPANYSTDGASGLATTLNTTRLENDFGNDKLFSTWSQW